MDAVRFDALARSWAAGSRRFVLRGLAAAFLAGPFALASNSSSGLTAKRKSSKDVSQERNRKRKRKRKANAKLGPVCPGDGSCVSMAFASQDGALKPGSCPKSCTSSSRIDKIADDPAWTALAAHLEGEGYVPMGQPRTILFESLAEARNKKKNKKKRGKKSRKAKAKRRSLGETTYVSYRSSAGDQEAARLVYSRKSGLDSIYALINPSNTNAQLVLSLDSTITVIDATEIVQAIADRMESGQAGRSRGRRRKSAGRNQEHFGSGQVTTASCTSTYDFWCELTGTLSCEYLWEVASGKVIKFGIDRIGQAVSNLSGTLDGVIITGVLGIAAEPTVLIQKQIDDFIGFVVEKVGSRLSAAERQLLLEKGGDPIEDFISSSVGALLDSSGLPLPKILDGPCEEIDDAVGCGNAENRDRISGFCCGQGGGDRCGSSLCCRSGWGCGTGKVGNKVCTCDTGHSTCNDGSCVPEGHCCPEDNPGGCTSGFACYLGSNGPVCAYPMSDDSDYTPQEYADAISACETAWCSGPMFCCEYKSGGVSGCVGAFGSEKYYCK